MTFHPNKPSLQGVASLPSRFLIFQRPFIVCSHLIRAPPFQLSQERKAAVER